LEGNINDSLNYRSLHQFMMRTYNSRKNYRYSFMLSED
jgi:hypothetical protein